MTKSKASKTTGTKVSEDDESENKGEEVSDSLNEGTDSAGIIKEEDKDSNGKEKISVAGQPREHVVEKNGDKNKPETEIEDKTESDEDESYYDTDELSEDHETHEDSDDSTYGR